MSAACTVYLLFNAFMKGLYFQPGSSYTFGVTFPALNVFMTTLCIFGLLEVTAAARAGPARSIS